MQDASEKAASTAIIHNFGQTPLQIFKLQHPSRFTSARSELPIGVRFGVAEQWELLMRSIIPITESIQPIEDIYAFGGTDDQKPVPLQSHKLPVPAHHFLSVQYGMADDSIRIYYQENVPRVRPLYILFLRDLNLLIFCFSWYILLKVSMFNKLSLLILHSSSLFLLSALSLPGG